MDFRDQIKLGYVADAFKPDDNVTASANISNGYHIESDVKSSNEELEGACSLPLTNVENDEGSEGVENCNELETGKVLELFPNYGAGYIRRLLAFYDNSSETVISTILEGEFDFFESLLELN